MEKNVWHTLAAALAVRLVPALVGLLLAVLADAGLLGPAPEAAVEAAQSALSSSKPPLPAALLARCP